MPSRRALLAISLLAGFACQAPPPPAAPPEPPPPVVLQVDDKPVYLRAEAERARSLEAEVQRLQADLADAEQAIVALEGGLVGRKTRADAVAATAAAGVQIERARNGAPWRRAALAEADAKLVEAERQIEEGGFGAAIFFASRAERIARQALDEARVAEATGVKRIHVERVNLREGPSTTHPVLEVLAQGTPVIPERTESEWLLVRTTRGRVGWVHVSLVQ